jgi:hypothetical protein
VFLAAIVVAAELVVGLLQSSQRCQHSQLIVNSVFEREIGILNVALRVLSTLLLLLSGIILTAFFFTLLGLVARVREHLL